MDDGNESVKVQRTPGVSCRALPWVTAHGATVTRWCRVGGRGSGRWPEDHVGRRAGRKGVREFRQVG